MASRLFASTAVRYLFTGTFGYLVNLVVLAGLVRGMGVDPYVAVGAAYVANTLFNYSLNRIWTFQSTSNDVRGEFARFMVVAVLLLVVNFATFHLFYGVFGLVEELAQTISILIGLPLGFTINRAWAFAPNTTSGSDAR